MQHITNVRSNGSPKTIQIINNQILIPSNIHTYTKTIDGYTIQGYEYDCDIYDKDEYLLVIASQANRINELEDQLTAAKILLGVDE